MLEINAQQYCHAVHLREDKCKGCVNCIKHCPTEAIRVRDGKANIIEVRCIDCGECVRVCPNQAKIVVADSLSQINAFKYRVALPAPAIYGQFGEDVKPAQVVATLRAIGFDDVVDVAYAADLVGCKIREILEKGLEIRPRISSACPAVVRLIQVRFPNLLDQILPAVSPVGAAAAMAREKSRAATGYGNEDIGVFFITPCPAKVSALGELAGFLADKVDGAIPISEIYPLIRERLVRNENEIQRLTEGIRQGSGLGIGWARSGGENQSIGGHRQIAVDGIHNVIQVLDEVERGKLQEIDYIEAQACIGGCVGGVLTVENSFITRRRVRLLAGSDVDDAPADMNDEESRNLLAAGEWFLTQQPLRPRPTLKLDDNMARAIAKREQMERIQKSLPGLDCGSCGAPNCQALAEDVVRGLATEMDCVFKLRERVRELAGEMMQLAEMVPPAMRHEDKKAESSDAAIGDSDETGA